MESERRSLVGREGTLEELMRKRIRATIEAIVDEELKGALDAAPSQRVAGSSWLPTRQAPANADDEPWGDNDRDASGENR